MYENTDLPTFDARLSDTDRAFCNYYIANNGDVVQAAVMVGYPEHLAQDIGLALLKRDEVDAFIREALLNDIRAAGVNATRVIQEVAAMAFANIQDHVVIEDCDLSGEPVVRLRTNVHRSKMSAVKKITGHRRSTKYGKDYAASVEMHDKVKPLTQLISLLGMTPRTNGRGSASAPVDEFGQYTIDELLEMAAKRGIPT